MALADKAKQTKSNQMSGVRQLDGLSKGVRSYYRVLAPLLKHTEKKKEGMGSSMARLCNPGRRKRLGCHFSSSFVHSFCECPTEKLMHTPIFPSVFVDCSHPKPPPNHLFCGPLPLFARLPIDRSLSFVCPDPPTPGQ